MDWINVLIAGVCSLLGALGGGGIFFIRENKRSKQIDNDNKVIGEWKEMYHEKEKKCNDKDLVIRGYMEKIDRLYQERNDAREEAQKKELRIQQLTWYHCTVNGCKHRTPPHVFDMSGNEICLTEEAKRV